MPRSFAELPGGSKSVATGRAAGAKEAGLAAMKPAHHGLLWSKRESAHARLSPALGAAAGGVGVNVFELRERLVADYANFTRSFVVIRDERIRRDALLVPNDMEPPPRGGGSHTETLDG